MEYIYKDEIMDMLGLDKNKAGDWKTYFDLYEIASDDIILGLPGYTPEDIGFNSPLYSRERNTNLMKYLQSIRVGNILVNEW